MNTEEKSMRLQRYLAQCGIDSRRKCETHIAAGRVKVNGRIVTQQGVTVSAGDLVEFDGHPVRPPQTYCYYVLNKPPGYVCSNSDPEGRPLALDFLPREEGVRLFHVGRLDMYSEGLIIFTNDGEFANSVMHPSREVEKCYRVFTSAPVPDEQLEEFCRGVVVDGVQYVIETYMRKGPEELELVLKEGKNREIRNLFAHIGVGIRRLIRVRIGPVKIGVLSSGAYRSLTGEERSKLAPELQSRGKSQ